MKIYNIFSKRNNQNEKDISDVYQCDDIPKELRVQIIRIIDNLHKEMNSKYRHITNAFGSIVESPHSPHTLYSETHERLCDEYGKFNLKEGYTGTNDREVLFEFFLTTKEIKKALDVIEVLMNVAEECIDYNGDSFFNLLDIQKIMKDAITKLNSRFHEHKVGYQYESSQITKINSKFVHTEVMKPALNLLADPVYKGANEEFLKAHEHYRKERNEECIIECSKAFESCLKIICDNRGWNYKDTDAAQKLIDIVLDKNLIPPFMKSPFSGFRAALDGGVILRNKRSAHGQGNKQENVPDYLAAYALHQTASNILLLICADQNLE